MAYRRKQVISRATTFKEEVNYPPPEDVQNLPSNSSSSSMATQAILASAAHRDSSSLSSAYGDSAFNASLKEKPKEFSTYEYTSIKNSKETKGFWGVLAQKAKSIIDDENARQQVEPPSRMSSGVRDTSTGGQFYQPYESFENSRKLDNPRLRKGLDKLTSSLNHIGDTIGNALEEGRTIVENKTADIIQETRKLQIRRKGSSPGEHSQVSAGAQNSLQQPAAKPMMPQTQTNRENQLKASRDVAMATAAKAKLLLRELKTAKADLAFAKERCAQLEEENKMLREAREKGDNPDDDDMIRLQLETLLAEKARLAHENSVYARENRFLREIVEYHQLTMQDVVYIDEGIEEVSEVYSPIPSVSRMLSVFPPSPTSPRSPPPPQLSLSNSQKTTDGSQSESAPIHHTHNHLPQTEHLPRSTSPISIAEDSGRHSDASSS